MRADPRGEDARAARVPGRDQRPAAQEPAGHGGDRPRPRGGARRHARSRSRTRSTPPTARARSRRSTRPTTSTRSSWSWRPSTSAIPRRCRSLYVRSEPDALVPLVAVASFSQDVGPALGHPLGPAPGGDALLQPRARASRSARRSPRSRSVARETLPATITTSFQGTAQAFQRRPAGSGLLLVVAILVIYMVLGILYESFIHPLTILSALPFAGFGALVTLLDLRDRSSRSTPSSASSCSSASSRRTGS